MAGAPKGNRNAAGRKGDWDTAVRTALKRYQSDTVKRGEALDRIAEKVVAAALSGDFTAISEIANRLDGRPTERREVNKTVHIVKENRAAEIRQKLRAVRPAPPVGGTLQ